MTRAFKKIFTIHLFRKKVKAYTLSKSEKKFNFSQGNFKKFPIEVLKKKALKLWIHDPGSVAVIRITLSNILYLDA